MIPFFLINNPDVNVLLQYTNAPGENRAESEFDSLQERIRLQYQSITSRQQAKPFPGLT